MPRLFISYRRADMVGAGLPLPSKVRDLLPAPFDWIHVPPGQVTLVNSWDDDASVYLKKDQPQTFPIADFAIGKYAVTNAQFAQFITAGGYRERKWWTPDGWKACQMENWTEPCFWTDTQFNGADQSVVGVSWYEAVAFCRWLSAASGEAISLPTEQQWQRAAQGDDNRVYPWGNEWDASKCNSGASGIGRTTPVMTYPQGASSYGVVDMVGNVWEWCLTEYYSGQTGLNRTTDRVLRGGSWSLGPQSARCAVRGSFIPGSRGYRLGFRLVVGAPPT